MLIEAEYRIMIFKLIALIPTVLFLLFISAFGLFALGIGLFLNGRILMKKESRRFANSLTLNVNEIVSVSGGKKAS